MRCVGSSNSEWKCRCTGCGCQGAGSGVLWGCGMRRCMSSDQHWMSLVCIMGGRETDS